MNIKKIFLICIICFLVVLALIPLVVPFFIPWTMLNCRTLYIDIQSGRTRFVRHLYFIPIRDEIHETSCSRSLYPNRNYPPPDWRIDTRLSPYLRNSPHYALHGAVTIMRMIDMESELTEKEKYTLRKQILHLWQSGKGKHEAKNLLWKTAERETNQTGQDRKDVPK